MPLINTPRLQLIPATQDLLLAELDGTHSLCQALDVPTSTEWPPDLYGPRIVEHLLARMGDGSTADAEWGSHYIVAHGPQGRRMVGVGGFKGGPDAHGTVEIGYSVLAGQRRQGFAREAVDGWLAYAFSDARVTKVVGRTLVDLVASIGVLCSVGFRKAGTFKTSENVASPDGLRFEMERSRYGTGAVKRWDVTFERQASTRFSNGT